MTNPSVWTIDAKLDNVPCPYQPELSWKQHLEKIFATSPQDDKNMDVLCNYEGKIIGGTTIPWPDPFKIRDSYFSANLRKMMHLRRHCWMPFWPLTHYLTITPKGLELLQKKRKTFSSALFRAECKLSGCDKQGRAKYPSIQRLGLHQIRPKPMRWYASKAELKEFRFDAIVMEMEENVWAVLDASNPRITFREGLRPYTDCRAPPQEEFPNGYFAGFKQPLNTLF